MTLSELIGRPVPFAEFLGIQIVKNQPGLARLEMALRPELLNSFHDAHGGVVMTLADVALAVAAITQDGTARGAITVDLSVSFIGPGKGTLVAESRCLRAGKVLAFSEGEIRDAQGSLVAKAIGTFKLRR
ncbi:MAG: PaaI family thioesterase [Deltaproteobacteria bacterium]|nr:PaaI family thioesterase [Deltaproteobacteria bacterium]